MALMIKFFSHADKDTFQYQNGKGNIRNASNSTKELALVVKATPTCVGLIPHDLLSQSGEGFAPCLRSGRISRFS